VTRLPCPHCGEMLAKPWWRCFPSRPGFGDFKCTECGQPSYFTKVMRLGGILLGMTAGAIIMLAANLIGFDRYNLLEFGAWFALAGLFYWAVAAFVCSCSTDLITKHWGSGP